MKKIISIALVLLIAVFSLFSCEKKKPTPPQNAGSLLLAFEGDYDEKKHSEAIEKYITRNNPKKINRGDEITIPLEADVKGAYIYRIAEAASDGETELNLRIDLDINYEIDKENKKIVIDTEWWYDGSDYLLNDGLWSFLVSVTYESGRTVWYYLRADFIPVEEQ